MSNYPHTPTPNATGLNLDEDSTAYDLDPSQQPSITRTTSSSSKGATRLSDRPGFVQPKPSARTSSTSAVPASSDAVRAIDKRESSTTHSTREPDDRFQQMSEQFDHTRLFKMESDDNRMPTTVIMSRPLAKYNGRMAPAQFARSALNQLVRQWGRDSMHQIVDELLDIMSTLNNVKFFEFQEAVCQASDIEELQAAISKELEPAHWKRSVDVVTLTQQRNETASMFASRVRRAATESDKQHELDNRFAIAAISRNLLPAYRKELDILFADEEVSDFGQLTSMLKALDKKLFVEHDRTPSSAFTPCRRHPTGNHSAAECRAKSTTTTSSSNQVKCHQCGKFGHYKKDCKVSARRVQHARPPLERDNRHIAININGKTVQAFIDTGAVQSIVDTDVARRLGIKPSGESMEMTDFRREPQVTSMQRSRPVTIQANGRSLKTVLLISPISDDLLLGDDLLAAFGIKITLEPPPRRERSTPTREHPTPPPTRTVTARKTQQTDNEALFETEDAVPAEEHETILAAIEDALASNASIPFEQPCNVQDAVVTVPTGNSKPSFRPQYRNATTSVIEPAIDTQVQKWKDRGVVVKAPINNPWNSALLGVSKKDANGDKVAVRVCIDLRHVNELVEGTDRPIPEINDLFDKVSEFHIASSLDLEESYHQLPVKAEDQCKLGFTWRGEKLMFARAPFGLWTLTGIFQEMMETVLAEHQAYVVIFVDDVLVFSRSTEEHVQHLNAVINALSRANLRLNRNKCKFGYRKLRLLGHIIAHRQLSIDPKKVSSIMNLPTPKSGKQLQAFLGMVNYLRCYIANVSSISGPLTAICRHKSLDKLWTPECQQAFVKLRHALSHAPVLHKMIEDVPLCVATDASKYGVGATLYQVINGEHRHIAFASKSLNKSQRNYEATKRELYAIIFALNKFHYWIAGRRFTLYTDHKALSYMHTQTKLNDMLIRWQDKIAKYSFDVVYRPGKDMTVPDSLSRLYDESSVLDGGRATIAIVRPKSTKRNSQTDDTKIKSTPLLDIESTMEPKQVNRQLQQLLKERAGKTVPDEKLRPDIIASAHDIGHESSDALFRRIWHQGYFWPELNDDCRKISQSCKQCLEYNIRQAGFHPAKSIHATYPFDHVAIDLFGPIPESDEGNKYVFLYVDIATRFVVLRPMRDKSAEESSRALLDIIATLGPPKILQSDQGPEFCNKIIAAVTDSASIEHRTTAAYHPQANGVAESHVKITRGLLNKLAKGNFTQWERHLMAIQLAANSRVTKRTKSSPFHLAMGRPLNAFVDYSNAESHLMNEKQLSKRNTLIREIVHPAVRQSAETHAAGVSQSIDKRRNVVTDFKVDQPVYIKNMARTDKTQPAYTGQYFVHRKNKGGSYIVRSIDGTIMSSPIPAEQLKPVEFVEASEDDHYTVEKIIKHRGSPGNRQYFVKWKDYGTRHNSWIHERDFDSSVMINKYWKQQRPTSRRRGVMVAR